MKYLRRILLVVAKGVPAETYEQCARERDGFKRSHEDDHYSNHGCMPGEGVHPAHLKLKNQMSKREVI